MHRGEALASLAETSVLEVSSKARGSFETHVKVLRGGEVAKQGLALQQQARPGTVVTLHDFLFNRPVRRKQQLAAGCARMHRSLRYLPIRHLRTTHDLSSSA